MDKLDIKEVMEYFKQKGYKIIGEYKNTNTYVDAIQISTNYKVRVSYTNLKMGKNPIIFGYGNPFCVDNMKLYINNTFPKIKIISNKTIKKKNNIKVELFTFKCHCGNDFNRLWYDIYRHDNLSCNKCAIKRRGNTKRTGKNKIYKLCKELNYKILECPNNPKNNDNILVEDIYGYKAYTTYSHMRQHKGLGIFRNSNKDYFIDNINNYCKINNIKTQAIEISKKQRHTTPTITFKCGECGEIFETSYSAFKSGKFRCCKCSNSISLFEYKTKEYLDELKINYIKEYSFYDCKDILPLPFDFYLCDLNKIIEIDGQQHFQKKSYFHNKKITFEKILSHDKIKNNYCTTKNIPILRIPYYDFDKNETYKQKILQFIKE